MEDANNNSGILPRTMVHFDPFFVDTLFQQDPKSLADHIESVAIWMIRSTVDDINDTTQQKKFNYRSLNWAEMNDREYNKKISEVFTCLQDLANVRTSDLLTIVRRLCGKEEYNNLVNSDKGNIRTVIQNKVWHAIADLKS